MTQHEPSPAPTNPDPLLTVAETASYAGVSVRFVWREIAAGNLFETRLGRNVRVRLSDLEAYLRQQRGQR